MSDEIKDLLPFYALGAVSEEERARVEAYLAENPGLAAELKEMEQANHALLLSANPVQPSAPTKDVLFQRVNADASRREALQRETRRARPAERKIFGFHLPVLPFYVAAGLSLLVALLAGAAAMYLNTQVHRLSEEVTALRVELAAQRQEIAQVNIALSQVDKTQVKTYALHGTEHQPEAQGQLIADPNNDNGVLVVSNLSPLETGQVYQVWLIQGDTPVSAGLLAIDPLGQGVKVLRSDEQISSYQALGISIEPEGGSSAPTGDIIILSEIS